MKKTLHLALTATLLITALAFCAFALPSAVDVTDTANVDYVPVQDDITAELLAISGSGTASDPFMVVTEEDLILVSDFPDCHFKLANDIVLSSSDWEPLCVLGDPFSGVFDGDGYTISNLTIKTNRKNTENGLFSSNSGMIKNLNVETSTSSISGYAKYLGVLVGYNTGSIEKCSVSGKIDLKYTEGISASIGGLVGYNSLEGIIENCYSNINIYSDTTSYTGEDCRYVGGLVGNNLGTIEKCFYDGVMDLCGLHRASYDYPRYYAGGVVGYSAHSSSNNLATVSDSAAISRIKNSDGEGLFSSVSGLIGFSNYVNISNCYAVVSGSPLDYGLSYASSKTYLTVINSFYDKNISGKTDTGFGVPRTTDSMKASQTYINAGWDFDSTWAISDDINNGYPYLQWMYETTYRVTYDANGGEGAPGSQKKSEDVDLIISEVVPTREGYKFLGWATASGSDTVEYAPGATYSVNADLNLYAVWKNLYVNINIGEKIASSNVRYYEIDGNQYAVTENAENLFRVVPIADMFIEIVEKDSADSNHTVNAKYYFVDYETLTYSEISLESFVNNVGKPSIRVTEPIGIRFMSSLLTGSKSEDAEFVIEEYGFIVALQSQLDAANAQLNFDFSKYIKGVAYNKAEGKDIIFDSTNDEYVVFSGVLYNIPDTAYEIAITSKTYTKISIGGQSFTVYGEASSASMYGIAKSLVDSDEISEETRAELENIIVKVEGEPPADDELDNEIEIEGDSLFD